jgi:glycosyltransferase involved in cell wall biosynthesis
VNSSKEVILGVILVKTSDRVKFSVVIPIYNEKNMLMYSLPSIYKLNPNEILILLDRCSDGSHKVALEIAFKFNAISKTRFIRLDEYLGYSHRICGVRRFGYNLARNDIIINTDADVMLDSEIKKYINYINKKNKVVSFGYIDSPLNIQCFLRRLFALFVPIYSGVFAFSKNAWLETEDETEARLIHDSEDSFLIKNIRSKYNVKYFNTKSLHLRPSENRENDYRRGVNYWKIVKERSVLKMFLHSLLVLRPSVFVGYLHARGDKI